MENKILIIVPAYNEEKSIVNVIESIKNENSQYDIIVINDGSMDNTYQVAKDTNKAIVIDLPTNVGIGGAVQTGFKYAQRNNYDIAIQFDGDGQHNAEELMKIITPIINKKADCVIGSRFLDKKGFQSTFLRRIGIKIFQYVNTLLIKQKITDNTSGFRAYNKECIKFLANQYPMDYPEPEVIVYLVKKQFIIKEVPVIMNARESGSSSINGFKSGYYMVKVLLAIFITYLRK